MTTLERKETIVRRRLLPVLLLLAPPLVLGCRISGTITDDAGEGMAGVEVNLAAVSGDYSLTTVTDQHGFYEFPGVPFQHYFIEPGTEGVTFSPVRKRVLAGRPRVDFKQDLGQWREYVRVFAFVEPADLDLYRDLLPAPLEMPGRPMIGVYVVDFITMGPPLRPYLEASIALYCAFDGEEGWYTLTMPVTDALACFLGRLGGFDKYVADEITLAETGAGWAGAAVLDGITQIALEFMPDESVDLSEVAQLQGTVYQFAPAGLDLYLNRITLMPVVPPLYGFEPGRVRITINPGESWAGLFADDPEGIGVFETFEGGNNMVLQPVYFNL